MATFKTESHLFIDTPLAHFLNTTRSLSRSLTFDYMSEKGVDMHVVNNQVRYSMNHLSVVYSSLIF
jgi:hypothetical protein